MTPRTPSRTLPRSILFGVTSDQTLLVLRERILTLRDAGFAVTVIASPGPHLDRLAAEHPIAIHPIAIRRGIAPLADLVAFLRIFAVLARLRPSIVTTGATGARDAVHHGHTGLLVPVEDSAALASALLQLLRDPALSQRMGAAARAWAAENFSRQQVTDATLRFFQEVAHQHGLV